MFPPSARPDLAVTDPAVVKDARRLFASDYVRVYGSSDVVGVELGGALKNIFAIAAGTSSEVDCTECMQ